MATTRVNGELLSVLDDYYSSCFSSCNTRNDGMIIIKLNAKPTATNIIPCPVHTPISVSSEEEITNFYEEMQPFKVTIPSRGICPIMGDLKANVVEGDGILCSYGLERNERADRLANVCHANKLKITKTIFNQPKRRRYAWKLPGEECRNQKYHNDIL